jgi:hypothetical protein
LQNHLSPSAGKIIAQVYCIHKQALSINPP